MKAEIIAIGSELVSGQWLDTNSQWLSRALAAVGIPVHFHTTLGDDLDENVAAFRIATGRADLVLMTGGLGPTQDDLTREALAEVAGVPLVEDACVARGDRGDVRPPEPRRWPSGTGSRPSSPAAPSRCRTASAPRPASGCGSARRASPACRASPPRCSSCSTSRCCPGSASWVGSTRVHRPPQDQPIRQGGVGHRGRRARPDGTRPDP